MKRKLLFLGLTLVSTLGFAQANQQKGNESTEQTNSISGSPANNRVSGNRAYEIIVQKFETPAEVVSRNTTIRGLQNEREKSRGFFDTALGAALKTGYSSLASQKAVNLTSNLINYTVEFIGNAIKKHKERFNNWYTTAKSYRTFKTTLSQQQMIGDFYALPSYNGAFDPENIAFKGIGCSRYFSSENASGERDKHDEYCYIFCSLRTDSVGMQSIVNHAKFLLEIDSIYFRPNLCDIPSNVTREVTKNTDFFEKQSDLNVTLNAKVYSSWFNEAIMLQRDQLLGSFDVAMKIDPNDCVWKDGEKVFVYSKANGDAEKYMVSNKKLRKGHSSEVSISGDCFLVPRSYSMDAGSEEYKPVWGTGEYRVELTLAESCDLNKDYYFSDEYKPNGQQSNPAIGNARNVAFANIPGEKYYDKKIWQAEWVEMKAVKKKMPNGNDKSDTFLNGAWNTVYSTIKGSSWTTTFLSPLVSAVTDVESKAINEGLGLGSAASGAAAGAAAAAAAAKQQGR